VNCILCHTSGATLFHERTDKRYGLRSFHRCAVCRLIFLDPAQRLSLAHEKERYDTHENDPDDPGYVSFLSRLSDPMLPRLRSGAEGLDFGSGPGPAMDRIFASHGYEVVNWDPFYNPVPKLLERHYDFLTCSETVEHFHRPDTEFMRMSRLVYPSEAVIGIMTEVLVAESDFAGWWYHVDPTHVCFYQRSTFDWIAAWLGLDVDYPARNVVIFSR
jgi:hypothetical protein